MLPAQNLLVLRASTLEAAKREALQVQRHLCFALGATHDFREYSFANALPYLESHRQQCHIDRTSNIAIADVHKRQSMFVSAHARPVVTNTRSSSSGGGGSTRANPEQKGPQCGYSNSYNSCNRSAAACPTGKHECKLCHSADHGQTGCKLFKPQQGRHSGAGNNNNNNNNNKISLSALISNMSVSSAVCNDVNRWESETLAIDVLGVLDAAAQQSHTVGT